MNNADPAATANGMARNEYVRPRRDRHAACLKINRNMITKADEGANTAKDFLLEEYRSFADSFWKNEQSGETRFNFFLALITAVLAGLVAMGADGGVSGGTLRVIVAAALFALVAVGVVTFTRILKRNESTDGYKRDSERVRQTFRDHFDPNHVLQHYHPFSPQDRKPKKPGKDCRKKRTFGGLAHTVAVINSLLAAGCAAAIVFPFGQSPAPEAALLAVCVSAGAVFLLALAAQLTYDHHRTQEACLKRNRCDPTHAGGVVFRRQGSLIEYLLVGPKKDDPKQWLFPKGHIELGEDHGTAALREVREETGVVAQLVCLLDQVEYKVTDEEVRAKYYLMRALYEEKPVEERRKKWFPFAEARGLLTYPSTLYLLEDANHKLAGNP